MTRAYGEGSWPSPKPQRENSHRRHKKRQTILSIAFPFLRIICFSSIPPGRPSATCTGGGKLGAGYDWWPPEPDSSFSVLKIASNHSLNIAIPSPCSAPGFSPVCAERGSGVIRKQIPLRQEKKGNEPWSAINA